MQGLVLKDDLMKVLKTCCRNGFFNLQRLKNSPTLIQYGPLGSLFTKNIWREWLSSVMNNPDISMFPIETTKSVNQRKLEQFPMESTSCFLPDAFKNYFKISPLVGTDNPFGFAVYGPLLGLDEKEVPCHNSLLRKIESKHGLCVIFFCSSKKSSDWFNYWARYRYRWWRKFSSIPSKFSMSDVTEIQEGSQKISLMMDFPWGKENIETISLYEENFFQNSCYDMGLRPRNNALSSAVIVCESELNLAAFTHLNNSFSEKWRDGKVRKLFHLNTKLAPYKVSISVMSDDPESTKNLKDVAKHLEKELKKNSVAVFPCINVSSMNKISHYCRFDEMGIPFTIVLNKKALQSGVAGLRNRDTTLEEQVHIAEMTSKILKYLQMKYQDVAESL